MFEKILGYVLMFFLFSMIGWTVESTYRSIGETITEKRGIKNFKIINSGFLYGPMCPIYGTGALVFEILLVPLRNHWWAVLLLGILAADIVEYLTSYLMEKLFHARWWDYSDEFLNINGRICFKHTIYWAVFSVLYVYFISPLYYYLIDFIPAHYRTALTYAIFGIFIVDYVMTVIAALDIKKTMQKLETLKINVTMAGNFVRNAAGNFKGKTLAKYDEFRENIAQNGERFEEWIEDVSRQFRSTASSLQALGSREKSGDYGKRTRRLYRTSPAMRIRTSKTFRELEERWEEIKSKFQS